MNDSILSQKERLKSPSINALKQSLEHTTSLSGSKRCQGRVWLMNYSVRLPISSRIHALHQPVDMKHRKNGKRSSKVSWGFKVLRLNFGPITTPRCRLAQARNLPWKWHLPWIVVSSVWTKTDISEQIYACFPAYPIVGPRKVFRTFLWKFLPPHRRFCKSKTLMRKLVKTVHYLPKTRWNCKNIILGCWKLHSFSWKS